MAKLLVSLFVISAIVVKGSVCDMGYSGERILSGDSIGKDMNITQCFEIVGAIDKNEDCYCQDKRPVFHMNDNSTHGCYEYQDLCKGKRNGSSC